MAGGLLDHEHGDEREIVDEELRFHLDGRTAELIRGGLDPHDARVQAEREFGDIEATQAYCAREDRRRKLAARRLASVRFAMDDGLAAVRALIRRPRSVLAPMLVLSTGIALNALVFSVVRGVLLAPLPFQDSERVHVVEEVVENGGYVRAAYPVMAAWSQAGAVEAISAYVASEFVVAFEEGPAHVRGAAVFGAFFHMLDRPFVLGRGFISEEQVVGGARTVVLSERLWRRAFAGSPDVIGSSLRLDGVAHLVVGVVRSAATFPDDVDLWVPVEVVNPDLTTIAGAKIFVALARVRAGFPAQTLAQELGVLGGQITGGSPQANVVPVEDRLLGDVRTPLLLLQAAVLFVLLAACANAAGMLLTRSVRRSSEFAVRSALGAGRFRMFVTLLAEGLALGLGAGLAGVALAGALLGPTLALLPSDIPRASAVGLDPVVVLTALALACATGVVTALPPALSIIGVRPASLLRQGRTGASGGRRLRWILNGLVLGQVALSVVLTAGAGLLLRSFISTVTEDAGFDPSRVTLLEVALPESRYPDPTARLAFASELLDRAASLPGIRSAALGRNIPITGSNMTSPLMVEGHTRPTAAAQIATVTAGYFELMGIELSSGASFGEDDRPGAPPSLIVDETTRAPDGTALRVGDRAHSFFGSGTMREVVGVAKPVRHAGLREVPGPMAYEPFFQTGGSSGFTFLIRSDASPTVVAAAARRLVRNIDDELPVDHLSTLSGEIRRSLAEPRFYTVGLSVFGLLAVLLALAGCQAGLAHRVAARRHELGLRMALGAQARSLRWMVLKQGLGLTAAGAVIGLVAAIPAADLLKSQLYGVEPTDPLTHGALFVSLLVGGALASDVPARRAARVDPANTLRDS